MMYFTSDLHLGHENCISMCNRPFSSVDEMNEKLIDNWNKRVHKNDTVYIVGDFAYRSAVSPEEYIKRLKGNKYLIIGNHDRSWIGGVDLSKYFIGWSSYAVINTGKGKATLCHFPMLAFEGKYLIHGHMHNSVNRPYWSCLKKMKNALNAGVDINGYAPATFDELVTANSAFRATY